MECWKPVKALLGGLLLMTLCTGCALRSAEELYALPKQSDAYYDLQNAIDSVMTPGASYSGPLTGSNQQAVQLADLDGNGQDEAIVFLKTTGEKPLKAYIFDRSSGSYKNTAVIEGEGTAFDAVEYVQLDGKPGMEIVVGHQISDQIVQSLRGYTYEEERLAEILNTNYSEFKIVDLDSDDHKDVFVVRLGAEGRVGLAELYRFRNGMMEREQEAELSVGAKQIKRIISGYVAQGVPAVFVASAYGEDTIITDIFAYSGSVFRNVTGSGEGGYSVQTVRNYNVFATDIDEDGVIELPMPVALPSAKAGDETFWIIEWYNLAPDSGRILKKTTFHNYSASWYLTLPEELCESLTVSRDKDVYGCMRYSFSKWNGYDQAPDEIFSVYICTGENRLELAQTDGRFLLAEKGETVYAASFGTSRWATHLTIEELRGMFHFVYMDWNTGEI